MSAYIPNPLRCYKCQRFGRGKTTCKGTATGATCGQVGHSAENCRNQPKCTNCPGAHSASSKECPKWALEKKVQAIKAERGVSFIEARRIVTTEQRVESGTRTQPMAAVVRAGGGQQRPTTRSTCTQNNLTWPDNQEAPTLIYTSVSASTVNIFSDRKFSTSPLSDICKIRQTRRGSKPF